MKNKYLVSGDVITIYIKYKDIVLESLIDTQDFEIANSIPGTWCADYDKRSKSCYVKNKRNIDGKTYSSSLHRLICKTNDPLKRQVDHINHNGLDNRKCNLRAVTHSENQQNQIGVKNIRFNKSSNLWEARITLNKKRITIGLYKEKEQAIDVAREARKKYLPYSQEALSA